MGTLVNIHGRKSWKPSELWWEAIVDIEGDWGKEVVETE